MLTTGIPALKRGRNRFNPPSLNDEEIILLELKARTDHDNDLLDYVEGLLSGTPTAKKHLLQFDEENFCAETGKKWNS